MNLVPGPGATLSTVRRSRLLYWLRSFWLMTLWEIRSLRLTLPIAVLVQFLIGGGLVVGYGFLIGDMPEAQALYLSTGMTVVSMITIGLVLAPQFIAQQKMSGVYDYLWALPVPKTTQIAAGLLVNCLIAFPGMVFALVVAAWRYDLTFAIGWSVVPAALLTLVTAASLGFGLAHAIPNPLVTNLITQVLVFAILLYSPISYPPEQLPPWLAQIHLYLPFQHSANVMRDGLTQGMASDVATSFVVLSCWALIAWTVTALVVGRRS